jgi:hypothetical protein
MPFPVAAAAIAATVAVAVAVYGGGFLSSDPANQLVWGRELARLEAPDYSGGPTPHPLANLVGALLSVLGHHADEALIAIGWIALGGLVWVVWGIARHLFGPAAAAIAVALVLSRGVTALITARTMVDLPFAVVVLAAVLLELRKPRRGTAVLVLLTVAGLLRPEAWLLAGAYWLWLLPVSDRAGIARTAAIVAVAPVLWALSDLYATGDLLHSLHGPPARATSSACRTGRVRRSSKDRARSRTH